MGYRYSRISRLLIALLTSGLLACGGGGSGGKKSVSAASSAVPISSSAALSSVQAVSSVSAVAVSSSAAPDPAPVTSLTLGAPTTNPIVIPPSATAVPVKFLSVVRGNYYPEQLLLDEVDSNGAVVRASVAVLKDDGSNGDAFRGDQIYSGQLLLGSVASVEKSYRVHADHKGTDVVSGSGRFWVSGCPSVARPSNPAKAVLDSTSDSYVFANEVLVTLADTVAPELSEINAIMVAVQGQVVGCIPALHQYLVELSDSTTAASLQAAIATLKSKKGVVIDASPNALVVDPPTENTLACDGQECQWYLSRIRAPEAWALVGGGDEQLGVGVIDFGVDCAHTDINCYGGTHSEDTIDHGTGVASLIAAHKGDGSAMVGVAWNTALYPFSFVGRGGSQYKMSELITLSMAEESIRVINISAATAMDPSSQIRDAMCSAIDSGRLIVSAAGNASAANNCQLENTYPARYNSTGKCANGADLSKGLLVVGAIDANNNLAQWENNTLCSNTLYVDIFAPGKDIYAASANNNGYAAKNGTSFASPLVAGSAAVLWAAQPTLTVAQVHDKLVASSAIYTKTAAPGRDHTQDQRLEGKPLVDLFAAVGGRDVQVAPDLIPDAFAFVPRTHVERNTYITSERITLKGIDAAVPIDIKGGFYAIDNAPFTSAAGTVGPNQSLVVQVLSANAPLASRELTLTVGGVSQSFRVTTAALVAAQPSSFNFTDLVNAALGASVLSSSLTIAGLSEATPITIQGGEYAIDGGAFTSANGSLTANQSIQLRVTASTIPDTSVTATVTIGGVSDSFKVTSVPADITPDAFAFADSANVVPGILLTSDTISVQGINTEATISISGGEFSIDGGAYQTTAAKVKAGQAVTLRHRSANQFGADTYSALTIGTYTATFRSRTSVNTAPTAANISIQDINGGNLEVGDTLRGTYTYVDADNDPEGVSSYRWLRNGAVIANATGILYVLTAADSGQDIRFEVTPVAASGITAGGVKESPSNPVVNSAPAISDLVIEDTNGASLAVGDSLRARYSYRDAEGDAEGQSLYRWLRNGAAIPGATAASYLATSSDVGQPLAVEVTPVALSGKLTGAAVVSSALLLGNSAPQATGVAITGATAGKTAVGATLTGAYTFADVDGDLEAVSRYRWLRNGTVIAGATSRNYSITAADSGQSIGFEVTPVAAKGSVQGTVVVSAAVAVNSMPSASAVKAVDSNGGSLVVGDSLTGSYSYTDVDGDAQGTSRYRWLRNGSAISGATAISYLLTSADSGQSIVFEVTPVAASGSLTGVAVMSTAVSINNSAPVASNVSIVDSNGGSAALGDTLNGIYSYSDLDGNTQGATTFSWLRNGSVVSNAQAYTLSAADSGKTLQFKVTPRATAGVTEGVEAGSAILTVPLFIPNNFSFTPVTGAALNAVVTSNTVTISGINTPVPVDIVNGQYAINGGAFTSAPGSVSNGQTLVVRVTASAAANTTVQAVLTVGGIASSFSVSTAAADTTPDPFSFPQVSNAALGSAVTSTPVTISGINTAALITVTGGAYSIDGGTFVSSAGTVSNGQSVRIRVTAPNALSSTAQAVLTVGGVAGAFAVSTATADTAPDAFSFFPVNNAELNSVMTSNSVAITGINTAAPISIVNGQYSINGGAFTSAPGTISNGQALSLKVTASANPSTIVLATVNVGGVTGTYAVSTIAADTTPDAFSFTSVVNAALGSAVTSNTITITGINTAAPISIINGHYSINGGAFVNTPGTVSAGQTVSIRIVASATANATQQATLTVGGVTSSFSVSTAAADTTPDAFSFPQVNNASSGVVVASSPVIITGINTAAPISVVGGEYAIDGGNFISSAGTVNGGQKVTVRVTSAVAANASVQAVLTVGGVVGNFSVTTQTDVTPNAFTFPVVNNAAVNAIVSAPPVTITGINVAAPVSVSGGEYSINGGAFVSAPGTVNNGQTITLRLTASHLPNTSSQAVLTVGGASAGFLVTTEAEDTTPDAFSFPQVGNAALGSLVTSAAITVSGINAGAPVSVTGGAYSINGGSFKTTPGFVGNGNILRIRVTAATALGSTTQAVLTVGGVAGTFSVSTAAIDTTPDAFAFLAVSNAEFNSVVTSNPIVITGINSATSISIANGQYAINGGAFTSGTATISDGQTLTVKTTASANPSSTTQATLNVGGVTGQFAVTTVAADTTPDAFSFTPVTNAAFNTPVISNAITVTGINVAVPVSIVGGEYAINGGAFTSLAGVVTGGQTINIRAIASANPSTSTQAVVTVGTASAAFLVTTRVVSAPPAVAVLFPPLNSLTEKSTIVVRGTASDADGISSIDVNGTLAVYNQATSSWQASVPLVAGVNNLIVTATDAQNNKTTSSVSVRRNLLGDDLIKVRVDAIHNRFVGFVSESLSASGQTIAQLVTIDRASGELKVVPGDALVSPRDLQVSVDGNRALVLEAPFNVESIKEINLQTGARKIIYQDATAGSVATDFGNQAPLLGASSILWLENEKRVLVLERDSKSIRSINTDTAVRSMLSAPLVPSNENALKAPIDMVLSPINGNVMVLDDRIPAVVSVNPVSGARTIYKNLAVANRVPQFTSMAFNSDGSFLISSNGWGLTRVRADLVYEDLQFRTLQQVLAGPDANNAILLGTELENINLLTKVNTLLTVAPTGTGELPLQQSMDIALDVQGNSAYLVDTKANMIVKVSLSNGKRSLFASNSIASGLSNINFQSLTGIDIDLPRNRLLLNDIGQNAIIAVDLNTASRTLISRDAAAAAINNVSLITNKLAVDTAGRFVYSINGTAQIIRVDTTTGERRVLSDNTIELARSTISFNNLWDLVVDDARNRLLVADERAGEIIAVDLTTGVRTTLNPASADPRKLPSCIAIDNLSKQAIALSEGPVGIYASHLETGVRRDIDTSKDTLMTPFAITGMAHNATNNTVIAVEGWRKAIIEVDLETGDSVVLSQ